MRNLFIVLTVLGVHFVNGQAPIQESFKLDWKIIPAYPNINAYQADPFVPFNYRDSRVEVSPTEQALLVNFKRNENGVILLTEGLSVRWQTPIQGNLFAMYKVNDKLVVIHNGSAEVRNDDYSLVLATVLDPATGKKILTKDLLGGKPDHYIDVHTFPYPEKKEIIIGFRHSAGLLKQKSKSIASISREDYNMTPKYDIVTFNEKLEQQKMTSLPIKKTFILYEVEMSINKNFILAYRESPGTIGLQVISGANQLWYKSYTFTNKERFYDIYRIVPSKLFPEVFYFTSDYVNVDKDPVLSLLRINYISQDEKKFDRVFTKDYKKELGEKWIPGDKDRNSRSIPRYWEYFKLSSIVELQDQLVVVAESVYTESYQMMSPNLVSPGFSSTTRSYNENSDLLLTVFNNELKPTDEKLIGKNARFYSMIGNFAGVFLKDKSLFIVSATDDRPGTNKPIVMKYDVTKKTFDYLKITDKGTRKGFRRTNPPSTIWFDKGFALVFWDGDESMIFTTINTDLQLFKY